MSSVKEKKEKNIDFLFESKKIGDEIIDRAIKEDAGWYWKVHDHTGEAKIELNLYNGNSGVIFFLIELFKITNDDKYLKAIIASLNWILKYKYAERERNLAYYCGIGGVIYVMMEGSKITNNIEYKEYALQLAKSCGPNTNSDILYGTAGSILTLLYLHNETNDNRILEEINNRLVSVGIVEGL
jgi:lantibiotic modifying enzyme